MIIGMFIGKKLSINDWNDSQTKVNLTSWDGSTVVPNITIEVNKYPDDWWGIVYTNPAWDSTEDTHLVWATAKVNSRTIEDSINNSGYPKGLRQKVTTHEIGHALGLGHPSASTDAVQAIMHQGWNGYAFVQGYDVYWINNRYDHED